MPERPGLDAVLLDAGGTLVRLDFEWMAETVTALGAPVSAATLRRAEIEGRRRYDRIRGLGRAEGASLPVGFFPFRTAQPYTSEPVRKCVHQ